MSYKIAIASNDGAYVDAHFGSASSILIIEVNDNGNYINKEERMVPPLSLDKVSQEANVSCEGAKACKSGSGCGSRSGNGCGGGHSDAHLEPRITLIADCRCLLCKKIGPSAERQLEKRAITTFQIDYKIEDALEKIIEYYKKIDNHISLRKS